MYTRNVEILHDTLKPCEKRFYRYHGQDIKLKLTHDEQMACEVLLPDEVDKACAFQDADNRVHVFGRCYCSCANMDTFSFVQNYYADSDLIRQTDGKGVLVLNLANAVHPGGGVRKGSKAQEEDLCRRSTLLQPMESRKARRYYEYNRNLEHSRMGSDAVILIPKVEVFKDEKGETLKDSFVVSVLTCAAPDLRDGIQGMSQQEYEDMLYGRIMKMLQCAA